MGVAGGTEEYQLLLVVDLGTRTYAPCNLLVFSRCRTSQLMLQKPQAQPMDHRQDLLA